MDLSDLLKRFPQAELVAGEVIHRASIGVSAILARMHKGEAILTDEGEALMAETPAPAKRTRAPRRPPDPAGEFDLDAPPDFLADEE